MDIRPRIGHLILASDLETREEKMKKSLWYRQYNSSLEFPSLAEAGREWWSLRLVLGGQQEYSQPCHPWAGFVIWAVLLATTEVSPLLAHFQTIILQNLPVVMN